MIDDDVINTLYTYQYFVLLWIINMNTMICHDYDYDYGNYDNYGNYRLIID